MTIRELVIRGWECTVLRDKTDKNMVDSLVEWGVLKLPDTFVIDATKVLNAINKRMSELKRLEGFIVYKMWENFKTHYINTCYYGAHHFYDVWATRSDSSKLLTTNDKYRLKKDKIFTVEYWNETKFAYITTDTKLKDLPLSNLEKGAALFFLESEDLGDYTVGNLKYEATVKFTQSQSKSSQMIDHLVLLIGDHTRFTVSWRVRLVQAVVGELPRECAIGALDNTFYFNFVVDKMIESLENDKFADIIKARFRLSMSLEEAGEYLGYTRERIRQAEAKILRLLRAPARSKGLKLFCDTSNNLHMDLVKKYILEREAPSSVALDALCRGNLFTGISMIEESEAIRKLIELDNPLMWIKGLEYDEPVRELPNINLDSNMEEMDLTVRTFNSIKRKGNCETLGDVIEFLNNEELSMSIAPCCRKEAVEKVHEAGFGLMLNINDIYDDGI